MVKVLYYAVNGSGQGVVFTSCPVRSEKLKIWVGDMYVVYSRLVMQLESEGLIKLPVLSWSSEPVKLELNLSVCSEKPL